MRTRSARAAGRWEHCKVGREESLADAGKAEEKSTGSALLLLVFHRRRARLPGTLGLTARGPRPTDLTVLPY